MTSRLLSDKETPAVSQQDTGDTGDTTDIANVGDKKDGDEGGVDMIEEDYDEEDMEEGDVGDADEDVETTQSTHKRTQKGKQHATGLDAVFQSNELQELLFESSDVEHSNHNMLIDTTTNVSIDSLPSLTSSSYKQEADAYSASPSSKRQKIEP